jgi:hypothetical protein
MRLRVYVCVALACLFAMTAPALAKTLSAPVDLNQTTKLLNLELKPGHYVLVANMESGQVDVIQGHKVVGHVKGQLVNLKSKSNYSEVVIDSNTIEEIDFAGKAEAVRFST